MPATATGIAGNTLRQRSRWAAFQALLAFVSRSLEMALRGSPSSGQLVALVTWLRRLADQSHKG